MKKRRNKCPSTLAPSHCIDARNFLCPLNMAQLRYCRRNTYLPYLPQQMVGHSLDVPSSIASSVGKFLGYPASRRQKSSDCSFYALLCFSGSGNDLFIRRQSQSTLALWTSKRASESFYLRTARCLKRHSSHSKRNPSCSRSQSLAR